MNLDSKTGGLEVATLESLTHQQQKDFRICESTYQGFNSQDRQQVYDALGALELLVLIGNADNVDEHVKARIKQLREAIKMKIAKRS